MKKILSKVLIAVSIFSGVNVSTGAMEKKTSAEKTSNSDDILEILKDESRPWSHRAKIVNKTIEDALEDIVVDEWYHRWYFQKDLNQSEDEARNIDKYVADGFKYIMTGTELVPVYWDDINRKNKRMGPEYWTSNDMYAEKMGREALPYLIYGLGGCRNRAATVLRRLMKHYSWKSPKIVLHLCPPKSGTDRPEVRAVILYWMADEARERKCQWYIADPQGLTDGLRKDFGGRWRPLLLNVGSANDWNPVYLRGLLKETMQIPLKDYLDSNKIWERKACLIYRVYKGIAPFQCEEYKGDPNDTIAKAQKKAENDRNRKYYDKYYEQSKEYVDHPYALAVRFLRDNHKLSVKGEEEFYRYGIVDLDKWCKLNCRDVLEKEIADKINVSWLLKYGKVKK